MPGYKGLDLRRGNKVLPGVALDPDELEKAAAEASVCKGKQLKKKKPPKKAPKKAVVEDPVEEEVSVSDEDIDFNLNEAVAGPSGLCGKAAYSRTVRVASYEARIKMVVDNDDESDSDSDSDPRYKPYFDDI